MGLPRFAQQRHFPHHIAVIAPRKMGEAAAPAGAKLSASARLSVNITSKFFRFVAMDIDVWGNDVPVSQSDLVAIFTSLVKVRFQRQFLKS